MPQPSDVAVIVCSRNRPQMLREALRSIAAVTPAETEVIVVDSGSDDDETRTVALEAGVVYVRSVKGLSIARNAGIVAASRPIVVFTDDDCHPTEGWIEALLPGYDDPIVAAVTGRMLDHSTPMESPYHRPGRYREPTRGIDAGHGAVMSFRREVLLRVGGFDDVMGAGQRMAGAEDLDMFIRLLRAGTEIEHHSSCVVRHSNTRVGDEYVALHAGYGRGLGALVTKWLRIDPVFGARIGARLSGRAMMRAVRGGVRSRATAHDWALLGGMVDGVVETWRLPLAGERFVAPWQHGAPTPLIATAPHREVDH